MKSTRLYLVRHGETAHNVHNQVQGQSNPPLSLHGQEQALLLARRLAKLNIDRIIASDLERAFETAQILNKVLALDIIADKRWRESHFGKWQGQCWSDIYDPQNNIWQDYIQNWYDYKQHGGESWRDVAQRVQSALAEIQAKYEGQNVLVISHGGPIRTALMVALDLPHKFHGFALHNTSITEFKRQHDYWLLVRMNDVAHLEFFAEEKECPR